MQDVHKWDLDSKHPLQTVVVYISYPFVPKLQDHVSEASSIAPVKTIGQFLWRIIRKTNDQDRNRYPKKSSHRGELPVPRDYHWSVRAVSHSRCYPTLGRYDNARWAEMKAMSANTQGELYCRWALWLH